MDTPHTTPPELLPFRDQIDHVDKALLDLLAQRFDITRQVGEIKRDNNMPPVDPAREAAQEERIRALAAERGIDPDVAWSVFRTIIDQVVQDHADLQSSNPSSS